jgi:hypothetical protein
MHKMNDSRASVNRKLMYGRDKSSIKVKAFHDTREKVKSADG